MMIFFRLSKALLIGCVLTVLCSGLASSRIPSVLEKVQTSGKLVVLSMNGPTTYYEDSEGYTGFEYLMAKRFAKYLGVKLEIRSTPDLSTMLQQIRQGKGDLAAAGLTVTQTRQRKVLFAQPYVEVTQQLLYRAGTHRPDDISSLTGKKLVVIGDSAHAEQLRMLKRDNPILEWEERYDVEMLDLIEMVHSGKIDYAVVDSNAYNINNSLYPKAKVAFNISEPQPLAWAFTKTKDISLLKQANLFFSTPKHAEYITDITDHFYGHIGEVDYSGSLLFARRMETRLPKWEDQLREAANRHNLDWQLLAALSYQESHWNPKAKSYTGVRGLMMLTRRTAKEVGVSNRLDPQQSIDGGALYFRSILDRIPADISEPDRIYFALAAYNIGLGHVHDARLITEQLGGDPHKWTDVKERLPLLTKSQYYRKTRHGYARGQEAADYVQNIRNFHKIIAWSEVERERLTQLATADIQEPDFAEISTVMAEAVKTISTSSL